MPDYTIGLIAPSLAWGGLEMNALRLAGWLKERGWRVILYTAAGSRLYSASLEQGIETRAISSKSKWGDVVQSVALARQLREDRVNLVQLHTNRNFILAVLAHVFGGRSFDLVYVQNMHVGGNKRDFPHRWLYSHLKFWVTTTPFLAEAVLKKTVIPETKIRIIPQGLDMARFTEQLPAKSEARTELKLPQEATIVGLVGRLDFKKGQHILIDAAAKVHAKGHPVHLLFVGDTTLNEDGDYSLKLKRQAEQLGLTSVVHWRVHMDKIELAYAALDMFVLTSNSETYGMVTIEAMASGLPIVGNNEGGTRDLLDHGRTAIKVKAWTNDDYASAIFSLLENPDLAKRLGNEARREALAKYSHLRQCEMWEELFKELKSNSL